ncbi:unnamed protein product [Miscanthus lutarioriparius]|uniref:SHSP domain-containing protein n=1 Tax=Miscanthus lutarioriparius TaxID=422564 RepID=A0A811MSB4_9POAL|nr:unnamed protein product [Miscanthus lutarioriparius]
MKTGSSDAGVGETPPPMDWKETQDAHVFMTDVPGLAKQQVVVELVDGRILRIYCGKKDNGANKGGLAVGHEEKKE